MRQLHHFRSCLDLAEEPAPPSAAAGSLSSLSPHVAARWALLDAASDAPPALVEPATGLLCWDAVEAAVRAHDTGPTGFDQLVLHVIAPLARVAAFRVARDAFCAHAHWCVPPEHVAALWELYASGDALAAHRCCLLATAMLERGIGNAYRSAAGAAPPPLFRELIESPTAAQVLGDGVCQFVRAFVAHPSGLNVRNVLWHGFVAPAELPRAWLALVLWVMASLGERVLLRVERFCAHSLPRLRVGHVARYDAVLLQGLAWRPMVVERSNALVPVGYEEALAVALELATRRQDGFSRLQAVCVLVTTLEHALRCAYCVLNRTEQLAATATSLTHYTTLDMFVAPTLEDEQRTPNALVPWLGLPRTMAILDLFHLVRLRARECACTHSFLHSLKDRAFVIARPMAKSMQPIWQPHTPALLRWTPWWRCMAALWRGSCRRSSGCAARLSSIEARATSRRVARWLSASWTLCCVDSKRS